MNERVLRFRVWNGRYGGLQADSSTVVGNLREHAHLLTSAQQAAMAAPPLPRLSA